jgi:hypothetical protein
MNWTLWEACHRYFAPRLDRDGKEGGSTSMTLAALVDFDNGAFASISPPGALET